MPNGPGNIFITMLLFTGILAISTGYFAWKRRQTRGAIPLALLMFALAEWSFAGALDASATDIATKIFWSKVSYLGIHSIAPLVWMFSSAYIQRETPRWRAALIWLIPLLTMALVATNEAHHLIWTNIDLSPQEPTVLIYNYGPAFWIGAIYAYGLLAAAGIKLLLAAQHLPSLYQRQVYIFLLAYLIPWGSNVFYIFKLTPWPGFEITPVAFLFSGILIAWGLFRQQLLNLAPIARTIMVDVINDGVIVINAERYIIDLNPSAQAILQVNIAKAIGKPAKQVLHSWPQLLEVINQDNVSLAEEHIIPSDTEHWYELRGYPLPSRNHPEGWLLILRDITEAKKLEEAIKASEALYRSVTENAHDGILIVQDNCIKFCNPQFSSLVGYPIHKIIEYTFDNFLAPDQVDEVLARHQRRMQGHDEPTRYRTALKHKDGHHIPVEISIGQIQYNSRAAIHVVVHDITAELATEQELREYARQQKLLNDITRAAIQTTNLEETLGILADRLGELIHADNCYITLWDEATETTIPAAASGSLGQRYKEIRFPKHEITLTQVVLERGEPLIVQDFPESPYAIPNINDEFPSRSILAIPLIADEHKLGAAMIAFNDFHDFSEDEIALGQQVSQQIGLAILKTHLLETTRQRAIEAETLQEAGAAVVATLKLDEAIQRILEQLNRVVPYDSASVQLLHGDELEIVGQFGFSKPEEVMGYRFSIHADNPNSIVIHTMQPHVLSNAPKAYDAFKQPPHDHIRGWMGVPLIVQDRIIGMLALDSYEPNRFTPEHVRMASAFAAHVAIALENARLYEDTHRLAITDPLIGIFNRRHFMELARREHQRALRYKRSLSIIMMDLDHFKQVNDSYGHLIGDQVLRVTALLCQDHLRETDIMGRYGGEEFVMLLPEANEEPHGTDAASIRVAERLRRIIANTPIRTERGDISITVSLGIVDLTSEGEDLEVLLDRADQALYIAKHTGRNRVIRWSPDLPAIEENAQHPH